MIILGIDPGTASTGYGILKTDTNLKNKPKVLDYGSIKTKPGREEAYRLAKIQKEIKEVIDEYKPDVAVIEALYFFRNKGSAISVSQAKGVTLFTLYKNNIPIYEFSPPEVKLTVTGYGKAKKSDLQKTIKKFLKLKKIPRPNHAADAIALGLCYLIQNKFLEKPKFKKS